MAEPPSADRICSARLVKEKALHQSAQRVAHLPVDAALGGRGELLRHQQDALLPRLGPRADALVQQGGLSAAGSA